MEGWDDRCLAQCQVLFYYKGFREEMEKGARRSTRRVLPRHGFGSEYSQGTAKRMGWSCVIDQGLCWKVVMFD
jgi:hypothetical protein